MKKILNFFTIFFIVFSLFIPVFDVNAYVKVKGYYRANGTYVAPYVRSNPNGLKTDNYGYTPSQGTYNATYGTRGIEWDTPTYITDPDYYEGKALYESGSAGKTSTGSVIATCGASQSLFRGRCYNVPSNAHAVVSNTDAWLCDTGYREVGNSCVKNSSSSNNKTKEKEITCTANAYANNGKCYCNEGYKLEDSVCKKIICATNASLSGDKCYCNEGYKLEDSVCKKIICATNASLSGDKCYCNEGYKLEDSVCKKIICATNASLSGDKCYCNEGYKLEDSVCKKMFVPANAYLSGSTWYCNSGYKTKFDSNFNKVGCERE